MYEIEIKNEMDVQIYHRMTFLEQMCWLQEEVEYLFKDNNLEHLRQGGKERYGEPGYGSGIKRLFNIIKGDPKNRAYLREVLSAEKELITFIYEKDYSRITEEQIRGYWNNYFISYIHQCEQESVEEE